MDNIPLSKAEVNLQISHKVAHAKFGSRFQCPLPRQVFRDVKCIRYSMHQYEIKYMCQVWRIYM
jgi:hypothetical protein